MCVYLTCEVGLFVSVLGGGGRVMIVRGWIYARECGHEGVPIYVNWHAS